MEYYSAIKNNKITPLATTGGTFPTLAHVYTSHSPVLK